MALFKSSKISGQQPAVTGSKRGEVIVQKLTVAVDANLAADDLALFGELPADHEIVDGYLVSDDLDTNVTPTIVVSVGVVNDDQDALVANQDLITADTVAQGGGVKRFDVAGGLKLAATGSDRVIGAYIDTVGATPAAGDMVLVLAYAPV